MDSIDNGSYFDTDDLDPRSATDGVHIAVDDYYTMGDRYAAAFLAAVPEPSSASLLALGGLALVTRRKR